jgi:hypothetical protein
MRTRGRTPACPGRLRGRLQFDAVEQADGDDDKEGQATHIGHKVHDGAPAVVGKALQGRMDAGMAGAIFGWN